MCSRLLLSGILQLPRGDANVVQRRVTLTRTTFKTGPFHLGRYSPYIGTGACLFIALELVIFSMPVALPGVSACFDLLIFATCCLTRSLCICLSSGDQVSSLPSAFTLTI